MNTAAITTRAKARQRYTSPGRLWVLAAERAERLGMKVLTREVNSENPWSWNGRELSIGVVNRLTHVQLTHEGSHWLVAPVRRRNEPGFGLGREPNGYPGVKNALINSRRADRDERLATILDGVVLLSWNASRASIVEWFDMIYTDQGEIVEGFDGIEDKRLWSSRRRHGIFCRDVEWLRARGLFSEVEAFVDPFVQLVAPNTHWLSRHN